MIYDTKGGVFTICLPPTSNKSRMPLIWPKINIAIVIAEDGHLPKFWTRCASHTGLVEILPAVKCLATCKQFPYKEIETSLYGSCLRVARHFTRGKMLTKPVCHFRRQSMFLKHITRYNMKGRMEKKNPSVKRYGDKLLCRAMGIVSGRGRKG